MGETRAAIGSGEGMVGPPGAPKEMNPPPGLLHRDEITTGGFFPTWIWGAGLTPRPEEGPGSPS